MSYGGRDIAAAAYKNEDGHVSIITAAGGGNER
jgi:hypothetical protein